MSQSLISTSEESDQETVQEQSNPPPAAAKPSPKSPKKSRKSKNSDDEDYVPTSVPSKPKKNGKGKRRREKTKDDGDEPPKKKPRKAPRAWSVEEEEIFLAGLEKFGRDWRAIANTLPFRDKGSISSHAQKHFINLFFNKIPLPEAVRKTGEGYTLSGKELDVQSAACRSYKNQRVKVKKTEAELRKLFPNRDNDQVIPAEEAPKPRSPRKKDSRTKKRRKNRDPDEYHHYIPEDAPPPRERPRRTRKKLRRPGFDNDDDDTHALLPLQDYCGDQPFRVMICPHALVLADLHAHLSHEVEIIGFLAGRYDVETEILSVEAIYPCKSSPVVDEEHNVEADPEAQVQILQDCEKKNMSIVGWYHSHPLFAAQPSLKDVITHQEHQRLFKGDHDVSPFIGLIVGPYTVRNGVYQSEMTFFVVEGGDTPMPMQLIVEHQASMALDDSFARMTELVERFPREEYQEKMLTEWKPARGSPQPKNNKLRSDCWPWDEDDYEGDLLAGDGLTRLVKVGRSMFLHLGESEKSLKFAERVVGMLWEKYGDGDEDESEDEEMIECERDAVSEDVAMEVESGEVNRTVTDGDGDVEVDMSE